MRLSHLSIIGVFAAAMLVPTSGTALAAPPNPPQQMGVPADGEGMYVDRATELLKQLRTVSLQLSRDSESLKAVTALPDTHWLSHAYYVAGIREHINRAGDLLREMEGIRSGLAPWQRQAVDRVVPVAAALAQRTEAVITHLRENPHAIRVAEYRDHVSAVWDHSEDMRQSVRDFLDYGETRDNLNELEQRLEMSI